MEPLQLVEDRHIEALNDLSRLCHGVNSKWYVDPITREPVKVNAGEKFMLMVSEIAEAMEGERKDLMDDKLPHRKMAEVELADALIRIFDYAGYKGYDLGNAVEEKMLYNLNRKDHSFEERSKTNGKKF